MKVYTFCFAESSSTLPCFPPNFTMDKETLIKLRRKIQKCVGQGLNNSTIARKLGLSRPTVIKWRNRKDVEKDERGWKLGVKRQYTNKQERMVVRKRKELAEEFFLAHRRFSNRFRSLKSHHSISSREPCSRMRSLVPTIANRKEVRSTWPTRKHSWKGWARCCSKSISSDRVTSKAPPILCIS